MPHAPQITVTYASSGWYSKLQDAIKAKNFLRIVLKGSTATDARGRIQAITVVPVPAPPAPPVPLPYPAVSTMQILVNAPALGSALLVALASGYTKLTASYKPNGYGIADDRLYLDLS